jgi:Dyp-type peroxidase family
VTRELDLADIQGNIIRPYGRFGFPFARHLFFNIGNAAAGRCFIERVRHVVTTSERWGAIDGDPNPQAPKRPLVAINIGLSFLGLLALELPTRTLSQLPEEFIDGMAKRWSLLGDLGPSAPCRWDPIWVAAGDARASQIHIWVSLNAQAQPDGTPVDALAERTGWLETVAAESSGITLLKGHKGSNAAYQDAAALLRELPTGQKIPTDKEHFGFTDGIGDPVFAGQYEPSVEAEEAIGNGKLLPGNEGWVPLATGEFILGHPSEAQELPPTAPPWSFMRNGTFMAYRKLHQNVASFATYVKEQAVLYRQVTAAASAVAAEKTIRAKMVGRWPNGFPLAIAPTYKVSETLAAQWSDIPAIQLKAGGSRTAAETARLAAYERLLAEFRYSDDTDGAKCPFASHIRRANPRDALDPLLGSPPSEPAPSSALVNRRRILRRGLPYGDSSAPDHADNESEHGVVFMALCGSLFRQFEFVQQQWLQYGGSFNLGNDTDPLVGWRGAAAKLVIPVDPKGAETPFICANLPQFVETRGGEYFFLPSLTALREIAAGSVDPT